MNTWYFHIGLVLWIFAVVSMGFAESYPNRPTAGELDNIVALGTECVRGVNERCLATQYQTNPVAYRVAPFTNATFYLDQSLMGAMASKIRSLVPYYVDPATVYNGTTNIVMLTVAGVWAELGIGDHISTFTAIPAMGANPPVYGDNPWRVYVANLQERYKVLNALTMTVVWAGTKINHSETSQLVSTNWDMTKTINEGLWITKIITMGSGGRVEFYTRGAMVGGRYDSHMVSGEFMTNTIVISNIPYTEEFYVCAIAPIPGDVGVATNCIFYDNGFGLIDHAWTRPILDIDIDTMPVWFTETPAEEGRAYGFFADGAFFRTWQCNYCTVKYW